MPGWLSCLICLLAARAERMQHTVSSIRGVARARNRTCIGYTMAIRCVRECVYGEPVRQMRPSETERVNREPAPGRVSTRCRDSGVDSVCVLFCIAGTKCDGECRGVNTHTHTHTHIDRPDALHCIELEQFAIVFRINRPACSALACQIVANHRQNKMFKLVSKARLRLCQRYIYID